MAHSRSFPGRFIASVVLLAGAAVLVRSVSGGAPPPRRIELAAFPGTIGQWQGSELPIEQRIVEAVGVDDHLSRTYAAPDGRSVQLYIGYYASQRRGDTIHSPKNCIPGSGWEPVRSRDVAIDLGGNRRILVNEYVIRKDHQEQYVLYWYHGRGRVVASEYRAKFWMVRDAIARGRTDGALVRVITSVEDGEEAAGRLAASFTRAMYPLLNDFIPE